MSTFFESHSYPSDLLQNARERVSSVTRQEALEKRVRENEGRIYLVLTYHPLTSRVKHILLNNFNILTTDPVTATIFLAPPVVAHRRDLSLRDVLVHTSDRSQTEEPGTFDIRLSTSPAAALAYTHRPTSMYVYPRFGEHLRCIQKKNTAGFPVAEHFNSPGHSLADIAVRGLRSCSGASFRRKQLEMEINFRLGTMPPDGLNNVFHFI